MKDLGELKYFLGIKVDRTQQGIFLSQYKYVLDPLRDFSALHLKPLKVSMQAHQNILKDSGEPLINLEIYQRLVGKLIYLTLTRPAITYTVHVFSQFMHSPTMVHYQATNRVLRYLLSSPRQGILLGVDNEAILSTYYDSDWVGCPVIRRFTTRFCVLLGQSPIS
ncbi:uncharacterized mitochondrial protein AtMg00810-like [Spinacia oleracea]|uniref:Uncharacterized mitochondrial protein AtMg00810-like n=1 Tax=Spinacia oleracea TaxID=3562 RepID=A0ABM3QRJ9_SPIOL|nr:uncharacterized mitochondrial protein AtMg00810-like [Spinacia oleracea]